MNDKIRAWLLEDKNPEIKLRVLTEYLGYKDDNMQQPMVDIMTGTFFLADPIKIGVQYIVYALKILGCSPESEAMMEGYHVLDKYQLSDGRYFISNFKSNPAFKPGNEGEANKWITFYAYMAKDDM